MEKHISLEFFSEPYLTRILSGTFLSSNAGTVKLCNKFSIIANSGYILRRRKNGEGYF